MDCLECGTELTGPYCPQCGQEARDPEPPAGALLREMVVDAVGADSTTWRSLRLLLTRPGALTVAYLEGKRQRYLTPFRLYLMTSVPFAALAVSTSAGRSLLQVQPPARFVELSEAFRESFFDVWPWVLVAVVPLFAAVYALLLRRARATFTRHLVFTLHLHAYGFAAFTFAQMLWYVPPRRLGAVLALVCLVTPVGYLTLALRRAYGTSWFGSVAATVGAVFLDAVVVALSVLVAMGVTTLLVVGTITG